MGRPSLSFLLSGSFQACTVFQLLQYGSFSYAHPSPYPSLMSTIKNITTDAFIPTKATNVTMESELQCYGLPYGGIGFLSHLLTYWTVCCLVLGRKPLWPWKKLKASKTDLILSTISLLISVPIACFTIYRCISRWQFVKLPGILILLPV
jgi:hypothetical protein